MNRRFWNGKRAFVTGHTGFKGSWLCAWLLDAGARVAGYALAPSTDGPLFADAALEHDVESTIADVRDRERLTAAMRNAAPEIVFHLAAQPLVRESFAHPIETFEINIVGTANLLDAVRAVPSVRAAIVVTSDKCYAPGDPERRHVEADPLGGDDPYSASKAGAEFVAASYRASFFNGLAGVATARAGNVIGGGDASKDRLLPDVLRAFQDGCVAEIRFPEAIRPWQHILDPLAGYAMLAQRLAQEPSRFGGAWNFGPARDHEVAVAHVADAAARLWGGGATWRRTTGEQPRETAVLRLDSEKAARDLGWRGRVPLETAVAWTIAWHRERTGGAAARDLMRRDFERFERLDA